SWMDRISKALRLAKERNAEGESTAANAPDAGSAVDEVVGKIEYSQTRRIKIPEEVLAENRVLSSFTEAQYIDSYKLLRTRVLRAMQQNKWITLGITSATANVGKTLTAVNLSISTAFKEDVTVMLVDADLRRPSVSQTFGLDVQAGLNDYLRDDVPVEELLIHPEIERFVVLPNYGTSMGSSEMLASPKMLDLVHDLRSRYASRIIIFDLPPVLVGDDVVAFAPHLDATIVVVEEGKTQSSELKRSIELLKDVNVIGTVLNKALESGQDTGYYY
ncbi:MAG: CpsD/CapB family tyrosine-protein kinase, partial [Pseudomonadota bacterium]